MHGGDSGLPSGFDFVHLAKEFQSIEAAGAIDFSALRQGRQYASDQAMYMKKCHDIQATVSAAKAGAECNILSMNWFWTAWLNCRNAKWVSGALLESVKQTD
jgi:hypothetical protein